MKPLEEYLDQESRIISYSYFHELFEGEHFSAFNQKISDPQYSKDYAKLRYIAFNFSGLLSRICADMLFGEPISVKVPDGDQDFVDELWKANGMDIQTYEAELQASALGDTVFKVSAGKRNEFDIENTVIISSTSPKIYYPEISPLSVSMPPKKQVLAWVFKQGEQEYLFKEIHESKKITTELWEVNNGELGQKVPLQSLFPTLLDVVDTKVEEQLVVHIPNWKTPDRFFGISDYADLTTLIYAMNNRMSKIDNVLDLHTNPILTLPDGVVDEKGKVRKEYLQYITVREGETVKPEYVVWDASLENAFKQLEKLLEMAYLIGEISPDLIGMGDGVSDSGKALKYKLIRTLAKINRKKLYRQKGLCDLIFIAQKFAKANGLKVNGKALTKEPVYPIIEWADGLPIDQSEILEQEEKALDIGVTNTTDSIMRIYQIDQKEAEKKKEEIDKEKELKMPQINVVPPKNGELPPSPQPPQPPKVIK